MITVFHEVLPESYLIILAPGPAGKVEASLAHQLRCAERSSKSEVWVDCSLLSTLSSEAARLLWATHHRLQARYARLVLVHVAESVKKALSRQHLGPMLRILPTLLDAARWMPASFRPDSNSRPLRH